MKKYNHVFGRLSKLAYAILAAVLLMACGKEKSYKMQLAMLPNFDVPVISIDRLAKLMTEESDLVILDTRAKEEYEVSHLQNARFVDYDNFKLADVKDIDKNKTVVVYCSIGYRSGKVGQKLMEAGYTKVYNLDGGILDWKNKGQEVYNPIGVPTDSVHTYNKHWSKYLTRGVAVY